MNRILIKEIVNRQNGFIYWIDRNGSICHELVAELRNKKTHINKRYWRKLK